MVDDPSQSVADPRVTDPNIIPPAESASVPLDRPVSTILADSPPEPKTPLADPGSDYTVPTPVSAESPVATESASVASSPGTVPADASIEASAKVDPPPLPSESPSQPPADPVSVAPAPVEPFFPSIPPDPSVPSSPLEATSGGSIKDSLPSDQPSQVQPGASVNAPSPEASQAQENPPQSAGIKEQPPQGTQNAPLADSNSQKTSFGDLTGPTEPRLSDPTPEKPIQPPVPAPTPSEPATPAPKSSFGDLTGESSAEEPTINIEPIETPKETIPPPPISPPSPQSPISPLSPQLQTEVVKEAKTDFSAKRQQALQTRRKKREGHLAKIIALVSQKGKISNKDVRDTLRVSQSTASDYLQTLVKSGKINKVGKAKATIYSL